MTTYLIEAYVAGGDVPGVQARAETAAAAMAEEGYDIHYLRSVLIASDETCFHLVEATTAATVAELARRAMLNHQRIVEALALEQQRHEIARRAPNDVRRI